MTSTTASTAAEARRSGRILLDCTLRDGGYYNNWDFDRELVESYLAVCAILGIDVVELGYCRFAASERGPYGRLSSASLPDSVLSAPPAPSPVFGVMLDAADMAGAGPGQAGRWVIDQFGDQVASIGLVRVAIRYDRVPKALDIVSSVRAAGFQTCVNLMQVDLATDAELTECLAAVGDLGPLAAIYLADSLGSLRPERAVDLVTRLLGTGVGPVGIHAHDNLGMALHNTLTAAEAGATWLDSTVYGMGRGAGNTRTEHLLAALGTDSERMEALLTLIARYFQPLLDRYRWEPSALYALAGLRHVHPMFVQRMSDVDDLGVDRALRTLRHLADEGAHTYHPDVLATALRAGERAEYAHA